MLKMNFVFPFVFFCIPGFSTMYICYFCIRKNAVNITFKREKKTRQLLIPCSLSVISEDKQGGITLPSYMFLIMRRCGNSLPTITGGLWTSLVKKLMLQEAFGHHWLRNYVGLKEDRDMTVL